ncbi:hypothetical protein J1N35_022457, partial [Gossypium stocksii]
ARCIDCGKRSDRSSLRLEPRSMKRTSAQLNDSKSSVDSGISVPYYEHYKRRHAGKL